MKRLIAIQNSLKCFKSQYNEFGGYAYRSCEDILEAVKPILAENQCALLLSDSLELVGERYYVKATASLFGEDGTLIAKTVAYAREEKEKKKTDGSQLTGSSSSYARKYALNGLFCIDDTKDADATNTHGKDESSPEDEPKKDVLSPNQLKIINGYTEAQKDYFLKSLGVNCVENLTKKQATHIITEMNKAKEKANE